jgi:hypothetical protein
MMETNQMTKEILDFQKDVISQWYDVMTSMQEQSAASLKTVLDLSSWMPDEGRRLLLNWVDACQKGCDDYKELVADSLSGLEKVLVIQSKKTVASKKTPADKRSTRKAKAAAPATAETASATEKPEKIVPPAASPKDAAMEKADALVSDKDKAAK